MFSGLKIATLASLAVLAVAAPQGPAPIAASQCNTGNLQCCQSTQTDTSSPISIVGGLLSLLGLSVQDVAVPVGLTCSPLSVIGVGSSSCTAQPVCCSNNSFNGVVALGCTPINLNL